MIDFWKWLCTPDGTLVFFLMLLVFSYASASSAASDDGK